MSAEYNALDRQTDRQTDRQDHLSRENTNCLKGIFAVCVLLCHLRGEIVALNDTIIGLVLTAFGYLSVAMFFFFSGYGLTISYKRKGEEYLKRFPRDRILSFYCTYLFALAIYFLFNIVNGNLFSMRWQTIVKSFLFGGTIVNNGWYLQAILVFYIAFWLIFKAVKNDNVKVVAITGTIGVYCIICLFFNTIGELWCESAFAFALGVAWATYREKIDVVLQKKGVYAVSVACSMLISGCTIVLGANPSFRGYIRIPIKMVSAVSFAVTVILLVRTIPVNFKLTRFLGNISLEIYIIHGLFMRLFCVIIGISNPWIFVPIIVGCTILSALLLHPVFQTITKKVKGNKNGNEN